MQSREIRWSPITAAAIVLGLGAAFTRSLAEVVPTRGGVDERIRSAVYDSNQVYRLHGVVGYQIDLEFAPGESFLGLSAGDLEGLVYSGEENHLFLKPKAERVATNLTVLTNRRQYHFDYTVTVQRQSIEAEMIYALRFTYPADESVRTADDAAHIDHDLLSASERRRQNSDYWYCGNPALKPVLASDDGVHTRLRFAANAELPAFFARGEDASESLLNYSIDHGDVIIHRVTRRIILRRGKLTGCVVNQARADAGVRLDSGTIAPDVERRVQGASP